MLWFVIRIVLVKVVFRIGGAVGVAYLECYWLMWNSIKYFTSHHDSDFQKKTLPMSMTWSKFSSKSIWRRDFFVFLYLIFYLIFLFHNHTGNHYVRSRVCGNWMLHQTFQQYLWLRSSRKRQKSWSLLVSLVTGHQCHDSLALKKVGFR